MQQQHRLQRTSAGGLDKCSSSAPCGHKSFSSTRRPTGLQDTRRQWQCGHHGLQRSIARSSQESSSAREQGDPGPSTSEPGPGPSGSHSSSEQPSAHSDYETWRKTMPPRMLAAMALSPLAALSLPLANSEAWQASARDFGDNMRDRLQQLVATEGFKGWMADLDERITFMDWTYRATGVDFSYFWDPELWVGFKDAVWQDQPTLFWNKLAERIEYKSIIPRQGMAGDMRISYGKFLQLLEGDRIKRVIVYGDMKTAIVEVPHPWYASISGAPGRYPHAEDRQGNPVSLLVPNPAAPDDPLQWFCPEMPEWNMEKYRFYVDLPGDFWDSGVLLRYLRAKDVKVVWDAESSQFLLPRSAFTKVFQVRTEVQVLDPSANWEFLNWLTHPNRLDFYEKAAAVAVFCRGLSLTMDWATGTPIWRSWSTRKKKKKSKEESTWEKLTKSTAREFMTKDAKTGKLRDTGVRFADIAGMDNIVVEMKEVVKLLLNDPVYMKVGAKVPRGIIFQGPPGTGKTYLARAIAGEAGVAFFSSVGSEFVEMFSGVAAARVNNLFSTARKRSPAIIFIDEIDAIGRARSTLGGDPGSQERESALLAMLVQMDGIHGNLEAVLTIGATNMAADLDGALVRPGRFEVVYEIPTPGPVARMEILKYHSRNKKLEGDGEGPLLYKVAELTQGWSAASLANLMNEAAILTVRRGVERITLPLITDIVEGLAFGGIAPKIPPSEAKNRLAVITAAKAVAFALTPGLEKIRAVTMWSRRRGQGPNVDFIASEKSLDVNWHPEMMEILDWATNIKVNAATIGDQRLGEFLHVAGLLVPLYAPRATEVAFYGPDAASLATASPLSDCFAIGYWCVRNCQTHPRFRNMPPLDTLVWMGEDDSGRSQRDPLAVGFDEEFGYHKLTLTLLKASWRRAQQLVATRRTAILRVAEAMLAAEDETISGQRLVELIESTPLDEAPGLEPLNNDFMPILREVLGRVPGIIIDGESAAPTLDVVGPATAAVATSTPPSNSVSSETGSDRARNAGAAGRTACTTFRSGPGVVSFTSSPPPPTAASSQAGSSPRSGAGATTFGSGPGVVSFSSSRSASGGADEGGAPVSPSAPPEIRLSTEQLLAVSRALMGRLDIVDLVGRSTAVEVAERVRDSLLHPETTARLEAVRAWVEQPGGAFPPAPLDKDVPLPLYGLVAGTLEYWQPRQRTELSWSAMEMVYNERQLHHFREDADMPADEDTPWYTEGEPTQASQTPEGQAPQTPEEQ